MSSIAGRQIDREEHIQLNHRGQNQETDVHQKARHSNLPVQSGTDELDNNTLSESINCILRCAAHVHVMEVFKKLLCDKTCRL